MTFRTRSLVSCPRSYRASRCHCPSLRRPGCGWLSINLRNAGTQFRDDSRQCDLLLAPYLQTPNNSIEYRCSTRNTTKTGPRASIGYRMRLDGNPSTLLDPETMMKTWAEMRMDASTLDSRTCGLHRKLVQSPPWPVRSYPSSLWRLPTMTRNRLIRVMTVRSASEGRTGPGNACGVAPQAPD